MCMYGQMWPHGGHIWPHAAKQNTTKPFVLRDSPGSLRHSSEAPQSPSQSHASLLNAPQAMVRYSYESLRELSEKGRVG